MIWPWSVIASQRKEIDTLREALSKVPQLLGPCRLDHNGRCQEHFLSRPCEVERVKQVIKEVSS